MHFHLHRQQLRRPSTLAVSAITGSPFPVDFPGETVPFLCSGKYRDVPVIPNYPMNKGPEVFKGKVMHSQDYCKLNMEESTQLMKGKKVTVVGYKKSAIDLAAECAEANQGEKNTGSTMKPIFGRKEENCVDDDYEKCFHQPEKKRRLTADQVQFLEKSFEVENKLEPERKVQLAKELNLQPRQVAIWFQNRRARYKTKQLEKDYDVLKSNYDKLKLDFDSLQKGNDKLKHEVQMLTEKLLQREEGEHGSMPFEFPTKELELESQKLVPVPVSTENVNDEPKMVICKQEDANSVSAKSDIIDSDSPHYTDGNHSSFLEPADSSNVFENQSDFSQDEEDNLSKNILRFPKVEYKSYIDPNESSLGYPGEDQPFWFWP